MKIDQLQKYIESGGSMKISSHKKYTLHKAHDFANQEVSPSLRNGMTRKFTEQ